MAVFIPFLYDQNGKKPNIGIGPTNLQTHKIISAFSVVENETQFHYETFLLSKAIYLLVKNLTQLYVRYLFNLICFI